MHKKPNSPYIFLNAVRRKLIDDIPLESSYDYYKKKGMLKQGTGLGNFLEACSVVFLSHMISTKEIIGTHNSVNTYIKVMMNRAEIKHQKLQEEIKQWQKN